jgi:SAM-dependent methyltransferase
MNPRKTSCPVCEVGASRLFATVQGRDYLRCEACQATFLHPGQLPSPEAERHEYILHRNRPEDPAYRDFLAQLARPLLARLAPGRSGLDYGCGPGPALAQMLREAGHRVTLYDPLFHPDREALQGQYDFITCTEVVEHFHHPAREFERLHALLKPGGWLAIQTCVQTDDAAFARWNYRRDPTHVVFYRQHTLTRIAHRHGWIPEFPARNVALLRRPL